MKCERWISFSYFAHFLRVLTQRDVGNNCPNTFCTFESVANLSAAAAAFGPAIASPISGYAVFSDPVDGCTPLRNKV